MRIVAINKAVAQAEVIRWGHYQVWQLLGCQWGDINIGVAVEGTETKVTFGAPGAGDEKNKAALFEIYEAMKVQARTKFADLDSRRGA